MKHICFNEKENKILVKDDWEIFDCKFFSTNHPEPLNEFLENLDVLVYDILDRIEIKKILKEDYPELFL